MPTVNPRAINDILQIVGSAGAAVGALYAFYRWVRPKWRAAKLRYNDVISSIERMPEALANMGNIDAIQGQVQTIMKQVMPNGGSSMVDSMRRIEALQETQSQVNAEHGEQLKSVSKQMAMLTNTMRANLNTNPRLATFEADDKGRLIDANKTYLRWTGLQLVELLGWGWINAVHPEDRARVRAEWNEAIADCRISTIHYRMIDNDGGIMNVEGTCTPIPEGVFPCDKWVGAIYQLDTPT